MCVCVCVCACVCVCVCVCVSECVRVLSCSAETAAQSSNLKHTKLERLSGAECVYL